MSAYFQNDFQFIIMLEIQRLEDNVANSKTRRQTL